MDRLIIISLIFLFGCNSCATLNEPTIEMRAVLRLQDGTFINNWPTGRTFPETLVGFELDPYAPGEMVYVDDSEIDKITYYGNWRISDSLVYNPTEPGNCFCSWSSSPADSLVFKFTKATTFAWIGERMSHHGAADVYFNDVYQGEINTYDSINQRIKVNYAIEGLDTARVYEFKLIPKSSTPVVITMFAIANEHENAIDPPDPPDPCIPDTVYIEKPVYIDRFDTVYLQPKVFIKADSIELEIK